MKLDSVSPIQTKRESFATRIFLAIGISYLGFAAAFLSNILSARLLGVEGKGLFTLFTVTISTITIFSGFGVGHGQMYQVSRDPQKIKYFIGNGFVTSAIFGGSGGLIYLLISRVWKPHLGDQLGTLVTFGGLLIIPFLSMLVFQRQFLLAIHAYEWSKANYCLTQLLPLPAYILIYVTGQVSVRNMIFAFIVSQLAVFLVFHVLIHRFAPKRGGFSFAFASESFSFGIRQYLSDVVLYLTSRLDFFLVTLILGKAALGLYSVAVSLAEAVMRVASEVGTILFPAFASSRVSREDKIFLLRVTVLLSMICAIALASTGWLLIPSLFGTRFKESVLAFYWLLPGIVAWSTIYVTWNNISAGGSPGWGVPAFGSAAILDAVLNAFFLPRFGVAGAGMASTISYWFAALFFIKLFCKKEHCTTREALLVTRDDIRRLQAALSGILRKSFVHVLF